MVYMKPTDNSKKFKLNDLVDKPGTATSLDPLDIQTMMGTADTFLDPAYLLKKLGLKDGGMVPPAPAVRMRPATRKRPAGKRKVSAVSVKPRGWGIARGKS